MMTGKRENVTKPKGAQKKLRALFCGCVRMTISSGSPFGNDDRLLGSISVASFFIRRCLLCRRIVNMNFENKKGYILYNNKLYFNIVCFAILYIYNTSE